MKKLISMLMAGAMVLALAAPAVATGYNTITAEGTTVTTQENKMQLAGATAIPKISLTMPKVEKSSCIIVNPYKLKFKTAVNGLSANTDDITDQIISPVFVITNKTDGPLDVTAQITSTPKGNMKLVDSATQEASVTTNWAFIQMNANVYTSKPDGSTAVSGGKTVTLKSGTAKMDATSGANGASQVINLSAPTENTGNFLAFQFSGSANTAPKNPWTANDNVVIDIVWNFAPAELAASSSSSSSSSSSEPETP